MTPRYFFPGLPEPDERPESGAIWRLGDGSTIRFEWRTTSWVHRYASGVDARVTVQDAQPMLLTEARRRYTEAQRVAMTPAPLPNPVLPPPVAEQLTAEVAVVRDESTPPTTPKRRKK